MALVVVNPGSSSMKFAVFEDPKAAAVLRGEVSDIGTASARLTLHRGAQRRRLENTDDAAAMADGADAVAWMVRVLERERVGAVAAIGHRVVHGGARFTEATRIDDAFLHDLEALDGLAPLHNPPARRVMAASLRAFPKVPQVAVFDTAYFAALPDHARRYALPARVSEGHGVRRYGFHGSSHRYLASRAAELLGEPSSDLRLITLHLGNGASVAATRGGQCIDTSMGFTPLEGLVMGTRCGDVDASVPLFLQTQAGFSPVEVEKLLNEESGLLGLAGVSDMREIEGRREAGDPAAVLAFDMFCYRAKKYVGAYVAALGGVDGIVFSGGIGERSVAVREGICSGLENLGIGLDRSRNAQATPDALVQAPGSRAAIAVIATDEAREIARQAVALLEGDGPGQPAAPG